MFVSIPNSEGHEVQLCPQTVQHPRDLPDIPATSFSPSQPGCNTERGTLLGGMEGEETGKRDVQPGLPSLPLDWQTSTWVMFSYIERTPWRQVPSALPLPVHHGISVEGHEKHLATSSRSHGCKKYLFGIKNKLVQLPGFFFPLLFFNCTAIFSHVSYPCNIFS